MGSMGMGSGMGFGMGMGSGMGMGMGMFADVDSTLPSEAVPIVSGIRSNPNNVRYLPQMLYFHGMLHYYIHLITEQNYLWKMSFHMK